MSAVTLISSLSSTIFPVNQWPAKFLSKFSHMNILLCNNKRHELKSNTNYFNNFKPLYAEKSDIRLNFCSKVRRHLSSTQCCVIILSKHNCLDLIEKYGVKKSRDTVAIVVKAAEECKLHTWLS